MQLKGWNDNEAPLHDNIDALTKLLNKALELTLKNQKILIHCSAGVGRTGTFIALLNMKSIVKKHISKVGEGELQLLETLEFSIFNTVRKLREQRWGMVYRREQYIFIYEYMMREVEALEKSLQVKQAAN